MKLKSVTLCLSILLLQYSTAIPVEKFYPFGESTGDQKFPPNDDEAFTIPLSSAFPFFDTNYTTLKVSGQERSKIKSQLILLLCCRCPLMA